jgi:hypothetical protein
MKALWIYLVLVVGVLVGVSMGQPRCEAMVKHPEFDGDNGITAQQREDIENLFASTEKQIIESTSKIQTKQLDMEKLMRSEDPDMRDVRKLVNDIGEARNEVMLARIERNIKMRKILGPEKMGRAGGMGMGMMGMAGEGHRAGRAFGRAGRGMWRSGMEGMPGPCCGGHMMGYGCPGTSGMGWHGMMMGQGCPGMMMGHGRPGMGCPGMMMGRGWSGMSGMGRHGKMMKGEGESGKEGMGGHRHMMKDSERQPKEGEGTNL